MLHGIDISHHQNAAVVPWAELATSGSFLYVRATYGTTRDRRVIEHVARARERGIPVGLYHFFRAGQTVTDQLEEFQAVADTVGYGPGDLAPALDIEADGTRHVQPWWSPTACELSKLFIAQWTDCMIYITQREWAMLGKPAWVLERPLWVAHYTVRPEPATPANRPWNVWQYRVGPYDPNWENRRTDAKHPRALDHNIAVSLPRIATPAVEPERAPGLPSALRMELSDDDYLAMQRDRDAMVRDYTDGPDTEPAPPPEDEKA